MTEGLLLRRSVVWYRVVNDLCSRRGAGRRIRSRTGVRAELRGQESNLHCWIQRPASFRWTTPKRFFRRLGGDRTLASPGKSRVRYLYATSLCAAHTFPVPPVRSAVATRPTSSEQLHLIMTKNHV